MAGSSLLIPIKQPFSWKECLWYLDRGFKDCLHVIDGVMVRKLVLFNGNPVVFKVTYNNEIMVEILHNPQSEEHSLVRKYVESWFDLSRDLGEFIKLAAKDKLLSPLLNKYHGLRMVTIVDIFEALAWSVIGQQINLHFAYKMKSALVKEYGLKLTINEEEFYAFPKPEIIADLQIKDLLHLQFSRQKADYLIGIANLLVKGKLQKVELESSDYQETIKKLVAIRGIGPWSANYVAMRCLKKMEAFPIDDAGLQNALKIELGLDKKPDIKQIEELGNSWSPWQAYATLYLWRSLAVV